MGFIWLALAATVRLNDTADVWVSSYSGKQPETGWSMGATSHMKLKGIEEMALIQFDVSPLRGMAVRSARLFLHNESRNRLRKIGVSTIATDWVEGRGRAGEPDRAGGGPSFNEASCGRKKWAPWPGADLTDVTMGNGNTLQHHTVLKEEQGGWFSVDVAPRIIAAMVTNDTCGIMIADESGHTRANNYIHSRESGGFAPYMVVEVAGADAAAPAAPKAGTRAAPEAARLRAGAVAVDLHAPADAFAYRIRLDGKPLPRWAAPHPDGTRQTVVVDWLEPSTAHRFEVTCVDAVGNQSPPVAVSCEPSPARGKLPRLSGADLPRSKAWSGKVFAVPDLLRIDPADSRLLDGDQPNCAWDGSGVRLSAARGEIAAFQVCVAGPVGSGQIEFADLTGPGTVPASSVSANVVWYVKAGGKWNGEILIPLKAGQAFSVPSPPNRVPGQRNGCIYVEIMVPKSAAPGDYAGETLLLLDGRQVRLPVRLRVHSLVIPDQVSFLPELNCYGGPGRAGDEYFYAAHRLAHAHRAAINRVPYSQSGNVHGDVAPAFSGGKITSWAAFDRTWGPLLDGSAFKGLPREGVPVSVMYLPLFESWPTPIDQGYRYSGRKSGKGFAVEHALTAPPVEEAFSEGYKGAFRATAREFVKHAEERGWTRTEFQFYLNNKYGARERSGRGCYWLLDEPMFRDDWLALAFYGRLFKESLGGVKETRFVYRCDISRPQWQRDWLDNICDAMYVGGVLFRKYHVCWEMRKRCGMHLRSYGSCNSVGESDLNTRAWCVRAFLTGAEGVLPWQSLAGDGAFTRPDQCALVIDARKQLDVPVVASMRLKALRRGAQDVEYLVALQKATGATLEQLTELVSRYVPLEASFRQRFLDEASEVKFGALTAEGFERLRESIALYLEHAPRPVIRTTRPPSRPGGPARTRVEPEVVPEEPPAPPSFEEQVERMARGRLSRAKKHISRGEAEKALKILSQVLLLAPSGEAAKEAKQLIEELGR